MGFSVKLAPGVRIRASSRGLRASVGPRAARLHVGAGRTGFSTGVGPVGYYTSLSGGSRGRTSSRRSVGTSQRALAQAAKAQQAEELRSALTDILNLHRQDFPPAQRPIAPEPPRVTSDSVRDRHRQLALTGIGFFNRAARRAAKAQADISAAAEIEQLERQRQAARAQHQAELDQWWTALLANHEEVVLDEVSAAFEDNEAPSAPVGVSGSELTTVVLVPTVDIVPEKKPATTPAGNLTLKKLTKTERYAFHTILVASHMLLTAREALAVAPSLTAVRVVALQQSRVDAFGAPRIDVLLAARFERSKLAAVRWDQADANVIVQDAATDLVLNIKRTTHELQPVNLEQEPALKELLQHVEIDELLERRDRTM
ncbi:DUF4236 domain-containing protein [Saccharothrix variisporea]|uniref:DUF4236 domain-containing protein n=1 Tax=Saccharothrix variisporea TaxID=543527 RepID=A0A495X5M3_9PSEU|nr:DUF4236 domain-containing protein [Saccharothrix variisporea]RKT69330.1 hypothetical protein DFJ66_2542 [Saccharothrix variisporea]